MSLISVFEQIEMDSRGRKKSVGSFFVQSEVRLTRTKKRRECRTQYEHSNLDLPGTSDQVGKEHVNPLTPGLTNLLNGLQCVARDRRRGSTLVYRGRMPKNKQKERKIYL